jgi:hypothetical protein
MAGTTTEPTRQGERMRELAYRESDGMHVTLLWSEADGELVVVVLDERTATAVRLAAQPGNALDVFNHPFAYA